MAHFCCAALSHSAQWEPVVQTLKGRVEDSVLDDLASQILVDTITSTSKLQFSSVVNVLSCQSEWGYSSLSITTKRFFHIVSFVESRVSQFSIVHAHIATRSFNVAGLPWLFSKPAWLITMM